MSKIYYKCPKCTKKNKTVLLGHSTGKFKKKCSSCKTELSIRVNYNDEKITSIVEIDDLADLKKSVTIKKIPANYNKFVGKIKDNTEKEENSKKQRLVTIVSILILSSSIMGLITGGGLYLTPDEFTDSDEIKITLVVENETVSLENATILINSKKIDYVYNEQKQYEIQVKPGRYEIEVHVESHKNATMNIYVPPQENNLSIVDYNQALEGVNMFIFPMEKGEGQIILKENTYSLMLNWCPMIILLFSTIGLWGAVETYKLKSYKNSQIGALFSVLAMGFFIVGPLLGITALLLLPKIKKMFHRSL